MQSLLESEKVFTSLMYIHCECGSMDLGLAAQERSLG